MRKTNAKISINGKLGLEDFISEKEWKNLAEQALWARIGMLKAGKIITRGYAKSTRMRRQRFGLQTNHVDLTGNTRYSKKQWRLLNQMKIQVDGIGKAHVEWKMSRAQTLYSYLVQRYGKIL